MKIFEIGHGKTGSTSLFHAMRKLGFKSVHWPIPGSADWLQKVLLGESFDFDFLHRFDFVGNGIERFYKQLDLLFPEAKFILLIRDEESWLNSYEKHLQGTRHLKHEAHFYAYMLSSYGAGNFHRELWRDRYREHNKAVQEYFSSRPDKLLVMNVCAGGGYKELCPFLGMATLSEEFPNENRSEWKAKRGHDYHAPKASSQSGGCEKYVGLKKWGWYLDDLARWQSLLGTEGPVKVLEVGAFDGVSANMMLDALFPHDESEVHCVDPYQPDPTTPEVTKSSEDLFLRNAIIGNHQNQVFSYKGDSAEVLAWMAATEGFWEEFDFIYVDGSHVARDVFIDAALSWNLLKPGGIIIFDDFEWGGGAAESMRPRIAIEAFEKVFAGSVARCISGWRRGFRKLEKHEMSATDFPEPERVIFRSIAAGSVLST